jgi:hypothetical protein
MSSPHLGPKTRFLLLSDSGGFVDAWRPLTRGRVCRLQLLLVFVSAVILGSESHGTQNHILLSPIRDSTKLEAQDTVFTSPRNRVTQLYPQALGSLSVASYGSQGYSGGSLTCLHAGFLSVPTISLLQCYTDVVVDRIENITFNSSSIVAYVNVVAVT